MSAGTNSKTGGKRTAAKNTKSIPQRKKNVDIEVCVSGARLQAN